jgi:hypothetical protein
MWRRHTREIPVVVLEAGQTEVHPDKRVLKQLGARVLVPISGVDQPDGLGKIWAKTAGNEKAPGDSRGLSVV